jgi:hypothetical protein
MTRGRSRLTVALVNGEPLNDIDLIALSDAAWEVIDPEGEYEGEEQVWTARLLSGAPTSASLDELRTHLDRLVAMLSPAAPAVPLRAVAAVTVFLAAHPDRHDLGEGLLQDALHDAFGTSPPAEVAKWLSDRRAQAGPHRRAHGARQPRRTLARPSPADTSS